MINNGHNIEKTNFDAFINAVGSEIQQAQVRLITAANAQMLFHYWKMGNYILYHQQLHGWGSKTIKQLAKAIRLNFPEKKGYSELLYVKPLDDGLVEIADKCCKKKEHGVLCHEGFGQSGPSETIVHVIEDALLSSAEVIELDNLSYGRLVVVGQDAAVCVFSFLEVKLTVHPFPPLNHKPVCLAFPLLYKNGIQLKLNAVDFSPLPASESEEVIVERTTAVGTDIEGLAVGGNLFHDLFRARAAISSETIDNKIVLFKPFEESLQRVLLMETDVCVAVAVLNADNQISNNRHTWSITKELLVCMLCIIFLCFYELMVEINIVGFHLIQFTSGNQGFYKQGVELVCRIEIIGLALIGSI